MFCDYSSTYKNVVSEHYAVCPANEVPCPNSCGKEFIKSCNLEQHLLVCPCEVVSCTFADVGCKERMKRQHLQLHMENSILEHQTIMCIALTTVKRENEKLKQAKNSADYWSNGFKIMAEGVKQTNWSLYLSSLAVVATSIPEPLSPVVLECKNYSTKLEDAKTSNTCFFGRPFYTHIGGYKMQLGIHLNGRGTGKGSHISVSIYMMQGENDDHLTWPFTGNVKIILLNQKKDDEHFQKTWNCSRSAPNGVLDRPSLNKVRNTLGWGLEKFISHTELNSQPEHQQFLINDTLFLKIFISVGDGDDLFS